MEAEAKTPEADVAKNDPASGSGNAANDGSLNLDNFLEGTSPATPGDGGQAATAKTEPDEYDAMKPDGLDKAEEKTGEKDPPKDPENPAETDVDGTKLVLPKGIDPDNPELKSFVAMTKDLKVPPEATQKLVDLYAAKHREMVGDVMKADQRFRETLDRRWIRENHSDPEFGGENYDRSCNYVTAALRKFIPKAELMATAEKDGRMGFLEFFREANIRNNPLMFRFLARVGKHVAEASPVTSEATPAPGDKSTSDTLFESIAI